ncbi:putative phage tail protein [uncultured Megamonas sp.]|uniref:putative phage tail protein n=1 Tax=uncultured Megamonas sp. TaxID=286140 RepID=UPI002599373D|nr:putative phage tail protein [uncultured Megamonas sp.]
MNDIWFRQNKVNILKYLPYFLFKDKEYKNTGDACSKEHERIRFLIKDCLNQFFVETATWGLDLWEQFLGLPIDKNTDYKTRRAKILSRMNNRQNVTLSFVNYLINLFVADKTGYAVEYPEKYLLEIMLPDNRVTDFKALEDILDIYIPAHIGWKYIGYVQPSGEEINIDGIKTIDNPIYIGGTMTSYFFTEIPADTTYEISNIEYAQCNVVGVVKRADIINILADYTV